jgi:uncharacterized membrane protein (UPF0182 family)
MDDHLKKLHPRARSNPLAVWMVGIFTLICTFISLDRAIAIGVESLWYAEVGYNHLFWQRLLFRLELWGGITYHLGGFVRKFSLGKPVETSHAHKWIYPRFPETSVSPETAGIIHSWWWNYLFVSWFDTIPV